MTGKEFYTEFFGVKDPKEKGTTINISVWRFAEAYAERLKQGQLLPIDIVMPCGDCLKQKSPCRTINCQYEKVHKA